MITNQELFNRVSIFLRTTGNPYGGNYASRGWGWVNESNPCERCALGSLVAGNTENEVVTNLRELLNLPENVGIWQDHKTGQILNTLHATLATLFENGSFIVNDKELLEIALENIAKEFNVIYTAPKVEVVS